MISRGKATLRVPPRNNHEAFTRPMCKMSVGGRETKQDEEKRGDALRLPSVLSLWDSEIGRAHV